MVSKVVRVCCPPVMADGPYGGCTEEDEEEDAGAFRNRISRRKCKVSAEADAESSQLR